MVSCLSEVDDTQDRKFYMRKYDKRFFCSFLRLIGVIVTLVLKGQHFYINKLMNKSSGIMSSRNDVYRPTSLLERGLQITRQ